MCGTLAPALLTQLLGEILPRKQGHSPTRLKSRSALRKTRPASNPLSLPRPSSSEAQGSPLVKSTHQRGLSERIESDVGSPSAESRVEQVINFLKATNVNFKRRHKSKACFTSSPSDVFPPSDLQSPVHNSFPLTSSSKCFQFIMYWLPPTHPPRWAFQVLI